MEPRTIRLLWYAQLCFYAGVAVAIFLRPAGLAANDGISYFGHFRETFVPYAVALVGSGYFCLQAGKQITMRELRPLALVLMLMAPLEAIITVAPVTLSPWLRHIHTTSGSILFSMQILASFWLLKKLRFARWPTLLCVLEMMGGIGSAIWLLPKHGFLIQCQLLFEFSFNTLLLYAAYNFRTDNVLKRLQKQPVPAPKTT